MNQSQFDSYSSDAEVVNNATPAKTLTDPSEASDSLFKGKDALGVEYSFKIYPVKEDDRGKESCIVVFYGHQTRIEMLFQGRANKDMVKNRLVRLGYFFKKHS